MTEESPIFTTRADADLWVSIGRAEAQTATEKRDKMLSAILRRVETSVGEVPSPILCRLIRDVASIGAQGWEQDIADLVAKKRRNDCRPPLTAASCLTANGKLSYAHQYLEGVNGATDVAMFCRVRAEMLAAGGKVQEAEKLLWQSLRSNPLDTEAYVLLQKISPKVNWMAYCAIDRMVAGLPYDEPPAEPVGSETDLYRIYREWYTGDRDAATRMLIASEGYRGGNADYMLLSARMSMDSGDIANARNVYEKVTDLLPRDVGVMCEAAASFLAGDEPEAPTALSRYRAAEAMDPGNFRVIRGLIRAYSAMEKYAEATEVLMDFLQTESADKSDYDYASVLLLEMGRIEEASEVVNALMISYPSDVGACVVKSRISVNEGDLESAKYFAKKAVRLNKTDPDAYAQLARVSLLLRQAPVAVRIAKKAVRYGPGSVTALTALMEAYREVGDVEHTLSACKSVLDIDPDNAEAFETMSRLQMERVAGTAEEIEVDGNLDGFMKLLYSLMAEERYNDVRRLCEENWDKYGDDPDVRRYRGNAEYACQEYIKASASFASAAVLRPDSAAIWHSKGLADEGFGDLDSALDAYDRAVLLDMKNPHYWISRGCVLEAKGDDVGAVESFNRAIELDQSAPFPLVRKAAILARYGRYSESLVFMDMAESADPDNASIKALKMKICLATGRFNDAAGLGRNLLAAGKNNAVTADLIRAQMGIGDLNSARLLLESSLKNDPEDIDLLLVARDLFLKNNDMLALQPVCRSLLNQNPYDRETRLILADALMKSGHGDEAAHLYEFADQQEPEAQASETDTDDPASLFSIAQSMLKVNDITGAGRIADKLLVVDPDNEDYIMFRAQVYRQAGDVRVAESFMAEYLRREPDSIRILEALGDLKAEQNLYKEASEQYSHCLTIVRPQSNGAYRARLLVKLAVVQENMKARPAAIRSYTEAVNLNPRDTESARALALLHLVSGDRDSALAVIRASLNVEESAASYAVLAQVCQELKDKEGVRAAYRGFLCFDNPSEDDLLKVVSALNSVGLQTEAEVLRGHSDSARRTIIEVSADVPPAVKRCAERLMRRAYMQSKEIGDPVIRDTADVDSELATSALEYLSDIPSYGDVIPGTPDYERMETLSFNLVAAPRSRGLDTITVSMAYVAGHARDADEAKNLVAYIASAKVSPIPADIPDEIRKLARSYSRDETIEQIMLDNHCGVMTARLIQSCI